MIRTVILIATLLIVAALVAACGPQRPQAAATPAPTWQPVPTFTSTPVIAEAVSSTPEAQAQAVADEPALSSTPDSAPEPTVTELPAAEPEPTATPTAEARLTVDADAVNVRGGPGVEYPLVQVVQRGESFPIVGRSAAGDWWQACCFSDQPGWLFGDLVSVENTAQVAVVTDLPPPPAQPVAIAAPEEAPPPTDSPAEPPDDTQAEAESAPSEPGPPGHSGTAGAFDPNAQYQIVHFRVLGIDDNNGGIFSKGSQQLIFLTVLDENGNGIDGAVVKDAVGDKLNIVTGSKGPGKAEIKMDWDPYKLYVASDPSGPVTSQVSNQMNNPHPHLPDVVGKLGTADNEYAVCPTIDDRCSPPFFHIHFSYEITFQKVGR